jgi:hypothetical protein
MHRKSKTSLPIQNTADVICLSRMSVIVLHHNLAKSYRTVLVPWLWLALRRRPYRANGW